MPPFRGTQAGTKERSTFLSKVVMELLMDQGRPIHKISNFEKENLCPATQENFEEEHCSMSI